MMAAGSLMDVVFSASLGILFLVVGTAAVFLMYYLWGFPFDHATHTSSAPKPLMRLHRILGWLFIVIYLVMMSEMVPRMWNYQVEWPARTVAHMCFGMGIGFLLLIKVLILRFFKHLEEWMPVLGTALLAFTIILSGLSMPHAFHEMALANQVAGGDVYSKENVERVATLLKVADLPEEAKLDELATVAELKAGRVVLLKKCVACHDLKTILIRPRSPADWYRTVDRMVIKPAFTAPITEHEGWQATAYLIAITRDLQKSLKERRQEEVAKQKTEEAVAAAAEKAADTAAPAPKPIDENAAKQAYENVCSQCHELADIEKHPPSSELEVTEVVKRMVEDNEMKATEEQIDLIEWFMIKKFVHRG
jgi:mono/diheme cytochrome c family protein